MDKKESPQEVPTFAQDSHLEQALVEFKSEKSEEGIFIPGSFDRENMDELDSMVAMMVAEILANEEASPTSGEATTDYNNNSGWIYSSQLDPAFVQCPGRPGDGTSHYDPESPVASNATTSDVSDGCSPNTHLLKRSLLRSQNSSQQFGKDASRKKELRLIKNRQVAKESRRRKKEYIKYLEARVSMLQLQNKKLREELNYIKGISGDKQQ